ncbi:MAG: hypothetical protein ACPH79_04075, partial [Paracoccaceae bacterium]
MISTLNGWSVQRYGGPETLTQVARPLAPPTADQVMLRIKASAVTRADTMMRRACGALPPKGSRGRRSRG